MTDQQAAVVLTLNQQQRELLDRTVARGVARDRESLVRLALREYAAWHDADMSPGADQPGDGVAQ